MVKEGIDAVREQIKDNRVRAPYLSAWRHKKSGGSYTVQMHVIIEATLEPAVVYYRQFADPRETWCRPASEFFDGRFEAIQ